MSEALRSLEQLYAEIGPTGALRFAALAAWGLALFAAFLVTRRRVKAGLPQPAALAFLYRLMVNLRFAVVLLLVIAAAAIAGTLLGGLYGEDRQAAFFRSAPFSVLMLVFMTSLALAVLSRYPWKKTHLGWIVTHAGLVVIVVGHMTTKQLGKSGRVDLFEGESTNVVEGSRWFLRVELPELEGGTGVTIPAPLDEQPDVPLDREYMLPSGDRLAITRYYPNFAMRRTVVPDYASSEPASPAVRIEIAEGKRKRSEWLFADDPREASKTFGGAFTAIYQRFPTRAAMEAALAPEKPPARGPAIVARSSDGATLSVEVAQALEKPAPLGASGFAVRVVRRFERLRIVENRAVEAEDGAPNEALEIELTGPGGAPERRWLFARMPEANTTGALAPPFELRYETPAAAPGDFPASSLAVLDAPGGAPAVLVTDAQGAREVRPLALGAAIPLKWLGPEVEVAVVDRYLCTHVEETPWTATYSPNLPALEVALRDESGTAGASAWVVWQKNGRAVTLRGKRGPVRLFYGPETWPLGFSVALKKFVLKTYEGTDSPKSFESFVRVLPEDGEPAFDYHIYMNHVMDAGGWRFFQSSYDPETLKRSIFQVSHDPGKEVVYTGYILTPLGLFFIVFLKPWLVAREARRRAAAGLARVAAGKTATAAGERPMDDPAENLELADQAMERAKS